MAGADAMRSGPVGKEPDLGAFIEAFPLRPPVLLQAENDPAHLDVDYWIDLYRRTGADAVTLAAGGYVAYYPTDVPYHRRSRWLAEGQDCFGALLERCLRDLGMRYVFARTDAHVTHDEAAQAHPEWLRCDPSGQPMRHGSHPEAWLTCPLGPYGREFMNAVHREIVSRYEVYFIFCNRWSGTGVCWCAQCRETYRRSTGADLPSPDQVREQGAAFRRYQAWHEDALFALADFWSAEMRAVRPGAWFIPNAGGGALSELNMVRLAARTPFLIADRQSRPETGCHWANGKNAKEFRAVMGRRPVLAGVNVGVCGKYRWMDSAKDPVELEMWLSEAVANGMVPRYTKHSGVVYNRLWEAPVVRFFSWLQGIAPYLRNLRPLAEVGIVYSQQTGRHYGSRAGQAFVEDPILGWYQALVESRVPFEMVHDELLDEAPSRGLRTLILPNVATLSDSQCAQLRRFVQDGGSLVATLETSRYDEHGQPRGQFGLGDLFGVRPAGALQGPMENAYLNVAALGSADWHALVAGLEAHGRLIHGTRRLPCTVTAPLPSRPLTGVPPYPSLPMEELYPRQARTDEPEAIVRQVGRGRVVYFPWDLDRTFWELLHEPHLVLLRNAVLWANGGPGWVRVDGPGILDVTVWEQRQSVTVHLVNLTNPMMMRGPYRQVWPVGEQRLCLRLPDRRRPARVTLLRAGQPAEMRRGADGTPEIPGPGGATLEIVAVDLLQGES